jgi:competence protein ComEC
MAPESGRLGIYVLDVGQGDCTFIIPPGGEGGSILFDCRDPYVAERFVSNHALTHLRAVVVSHLDQDHIRGIVPFLQGHFDSGRTVESLVIGIDRPPGPDGPGREIRTLLERALYWEANPPCEGFVLEDATRRREPLRIAGGPDWFVELVLPFHGDVMRAAGLGDADPNTCSAVMRICRARTSVLVGGDAPLSSWDRLEPALLPARAIRVPHHAGGTERGGRYASYEDLYRTIDAQHALISVGTNNNYGHPAPAHVAAARRGGACRVRCTQLTPRCHPSPSDLRSEALRHAAGVEWPYRHHARSGDPRRTPTQETPCAGTMAVSIDALGRLSILPRPGGAHDKLIRKVPAPLCEG